MMNALSPMTRPTPTETQQAQDYGRRMASTVFDDASDRVEGVRPYDAWTEGNGDWRVWRRAAASAAGLDADAHDGWHADECADCEVVDEIARVADDEAASLWSALAGLSESARAHVEERIAKDTLLTIVLDFYSSEIALTVGDYGDPREAVLAAIAWALPARVERDLYRKSTGDTYAIRLAPRGEMEAQDAVIEVVVLGSDGAKVAYRYSDHSTDCDWALGTIDDACREAIEDLERILDEYDEHGDE